jgi:adenylosuccinate synthase
VELKGWESDITSAKTFQDLPENAQKYVKFIEEFVGIKAQYIGVGYVYNFYRSILSS